MRAKVLVASHIAQQSFVQAINDDFLVAAGITILTLIPIFILRVKKRSKKKEHVAAME
jgi:DHA2 family multidrug resistance protein